jgi:IclR family acetate operon transcriptional repressor
MAGQDGSLDTARAPSGAKRIQSVDRAMELLKQVAHARTPQAVGDLAAATGLNRSTAWRLLITLEDHGMVDRDPLTQGYVPGYELLRLAGAKPAHEMLTTRARPVLDQLCRDTGETVNLLVPTAGGIVSVDQREAPKLTSVNIVGIRLPLHATASGKLRLAYAAEDELADLAGGALERFTDQTIVELDTLTKELAQVRGQGYALECDEFELGVSGVSAPVFATHDRVAAFVSIWGLTARLSRDRLEELATSVRAAATQITRLVVAATEAT